MLGGILGGLLTAWVLTMFKAEDVVIEFAQHFTEIELGIEHYYMFFGAVGLVGGLIHDIIHQEK